MTGVEILAMEEVVANSIFNWLAFWITFGIIFGIFVIIGVILSIGFFDWSNIVISIVFGLILSFAFGYISGDTMRIPTEYETQYKVIISDEVSMNEFVEKYEIIDQEGKIYTVRERAGDVNE